MRKVALVLIPIQPVIKNIETVPAFRDLLRAAGEKPAVVIVNHAPIQGSRHIHAQEAAERAGFIICPVVIFTVLRFTIHPCQGLLGKEYEPDGKAARKMNLPQTYP